MKVKMEYKKSLYITINEILKWCQLMKIYYSSNETKTHCNC